MNLYIFSTFVLIAFFQGCLAQRSRQQQSSSSSAVDSEPVFGGRGGGGGGDVRYSNSRVALSPKRSSRNQERPVGSPIPGVSYLETPSSGGRADESSRSRSTKRPIVAPIPGVSYLETQSGLSGVPSEAPLDDNWLRAEQSTTTKTPKKKKKKVKKVKGDEEDDEDEWKMRYGTWKRHYPFSGNKAQEFAATSEYRTIQEGSYYDKANENTPKDNHSTVFDWDSTTRSRHHRHRHHRTSTTQRPTAPPVPAAYYYPYDRNYLLSLGRDDRSYAALESGSENYDPYSTTTRTPWWYSTTTRRPTNPWHYYTSTTTTTQRPTVPWYYTTNATTTQRPTVPWWYYTTNATTTQRPTVPWWYYTTNATTTQRPTVPWWYYTTNATTTQRPTVPWYYTTTTTTQRPTVPWYYTTTTTQRPTAPWYYTTSTTTAKPTTTTPWRSWRTSTRPTSGSISYYQRERPSATIKHKTSEQVSYVSGSYFPGSTGHRKPATGFNVRQRKAHDSDPVTSAPVSETYPTVRIHYYPKKDGRIRQQPESDDSSVDDTAHPFSAFVGSTTCDQGSCYPATGNLLVGREDRLTATSTCGQRKPERFCIVSHLQDRKKCFICDSRHGGRQKQSHRIESIVSKPGKRKEFWWQSENGVEEVSVQLDLEAEFHFTHLIITFKTFRPASLLIERSFDFGRTWKVYRYFAYDCAESFPGIPIGQPQRITDVTCESRYSGVAPSTEGEVIFRVLNPYLRIENPYSEEVQNLLKMTNLRVNFTKLHTLGDDLVDNREEIKEKYYYAVYDMVVRGSCSCYGHASRCVELPGSPQRPDMVHGRCECTHNTKGLNCEHCDDFYNDLPWRPAFGRSSNACKRCNCHEHSTRCHFDPAVYEATGRISGGVCDDCEHNTRGQKCEQCRPFYYHDPSRRIEDPHACQPCDCDPRGSLDEGICEATGPEAGRCHCKENADGRRCDNCKNGFWNFDESNPVGCQPCSCDLKGTVENQGCNPYTGECICKRNVIGRDCNQCMSEFWGLSEDRDGCQQCDCDPGGARDNNCDVITGQCRCRPHVTGRRCDHPEQGYFSGLLDYLTYEAELSRGTANSQVVVREPYGDRETTWTGLGFMRVYEESHLEFDIENIQTGMEYDLVIRYEPQLPGRWDEVKVFVERPGPIDNRGVCVNTTPKDDVKTVSLPPGSRNVVVQPPVCLEANKRYKIRLEFRRYDPAVPTPSATLLIDSIVLLPRVDGISFYQGSPVNTYRRQEFERFRCGQAYTSVVKSPIADVCKQHIFSISLITYGEAFECSCDPTGSVSSICDSLGGQCQCKPNVVGRRCDRCAPGTYSFSPSGCTPCDCNSVGALDNFCNVTTGSCNCRPNTYGRQCDECRPGYWNYPNCRPCECNGHADRCDPRTGYCIDCRDYSAGAHCDVCESGFYGDPRSGYNINCRPCPCPGVPGGGHNFGATCLLDQRTQNVICNCEEGYSGERCDRCANNFYGNPQVPGGICQQCQCNNNIDLTRLGNCDPNTGQCQQCLFNTEGFFCERCKPGHWGDAINQNCIECNCDILGTDITQNGGYCDSQTGQCPCLKNVEGMSCDRCKPNHWKLASGEGCESCACDPLGSYAEQCNEFDGQCNCKPGFGGRKCDQCQATFWGDPRVKCQPCDCDRSGSESLQCHRNNGTCICRQGIGGEKCNRCARGYIGQAPYCTPCGECFDNWDYIITQLKGETLVLIELAGNIKNKGVTSVYNKEFEEMEEKLSQVRRILDQANVTTADIEVLQNLVDELRQNLTSSGLRLDELGTEIDNTTQRIYDANQQLASLQANADKLQRDAKELEKNATELQVKDIEGALNITKEAWERSRAAQVKVNGAEETIRESERERKRTEVLITQAEGEYNRTYTENKKSLDDIEADINRLQDEIPGINQDVCDGRGDPCSPLCGGALCDKCGGLSCNEGAATKAENALKLAEDADQILKDKDGQASQLLQDISKAKRDADEAKDEAQKAFEKAGLARNRSANVKESVEDVIGRINDFLEGEKAKPSDIRLRAEETLALNIKLRPEEITDLANQINDTISKLTNIDGILAETAGDLARTENLKKRADKAKQDAVDVLGTAKKVTGALDDAKEAQDRAQEAIDKANGDIDATETDLTQIASETAAAQGVANKSVDDIEELKERLAGLREKFVENELAVDQAGKASRNADDLANKAKSGANDLGRKYDEVTRKLDEKAKSSGDAKDRAEKLRERADALAQNATDKLNELKDMENEFNLHETSLKSLSDELEELERRMREYMGTIEQRANYYRDCTP